MARLLTVQEIADYLQVKPSTIYQWTHEGYIPHLKIGNLLRFKQSQVDSWLEKRSVSGRTRRKPEITINP